MRLETEKYLLDQIKEKGTIHFTLVDPDKSSGYDCAEIAVEAEKGGTTAIMVGGSTLASSGDLCRVRIQYVPAHLPEDRVM